MTDRARVATLTVLVELRLRGGAWQIEASAFLGEPVSMRRPPVAVVQPPGRMLAAL